MQNDRKPGGDKMQRKICALVALIVAAVDFSAQLSQGQAADPPRRSLQSRASFLVPQYDIKAVINWGMLTSLSQSLVRARYKSEFDNHNSPFCSSPDVAVSLDTINFNGETSYNLFSGSANSTISLYLHGEATETDCRLATVKFACAQARPISSSMPQKVEIEARCRAIWNGITIPFKSKQEVEVPLVIPQELQLNLPAPTGGLNIRFAEYTNGKWQILPPPRDKIKKVPFGGQAFFHPRLLPPILGSPSSFKLPGDFLTIGALNRETVSVGRPEDALIRRMPSLIPFQNPYALVSLQIAESAIAPRAVPNPTAPRFGILGAYFPLIVSGEVNIDPLPKPLAVNLVIGSATASITDTTGKPSISVGISIDEVSLSYDGQSLPVTNQPIAPIVKLSEFSVDAQGDIRIAAASLELKIQSIVGGQKIELPLGDHLRDAINSSLPSLGKLKTRIIVDTPDCTYVGDKWKAMGPCADGSYREEYAWRESAYERRGIALDPSRAILSGKNGYLFITFVAEPIP